MPTSKPDSIASAANAQPGGQVMIYMSGHGTQVPIPEKQTNPLDPRNPEPDGKDEIFLPSDVKSWSAEGVENAIRDDDIGQWLDAIRGRAQMFGSSSIAATRAP